MAMATQTAWRSARQMAFASVIAGATSLAAMFPAAAQQRQATSITPQSEGVTVNTDCRNYKPGVLLATGECEILKVQVLDKLDICISELLKLKKTSPAKFQELGKVTRDNACELVGRIKPSASIGSQGPQVGG